MNWEFSRHGEPGIYASETKRIKSLGKPWLRLENSIKIYLREMRRGQVNWCEMAWGRVQWRDFVTLVLELFEVLSIKFQVEVFRVVTPCNVVVGYWRFRGPCCLCFHNTKDLDVEHHRCESIKILTINFLVSWIAKGRDSSVGVALGYGLDDRGSRVRFPAGAGNFSLHHRVQNGSGGPRSLLSKGYRGLFPWG
jgi:hypothetical protein